MDYSATLTSAVTGAAGSTVAAQIGNEVITWTCICISVATMVINFILDTKRKFTNERYENKLREYEREIFELKRKK